MVTGISLTGVFLLLLLLILIQFIKVSLAHLNKKKIYNNPENVFYCC